MNTTAGICSTRARYLASILSKGTSGFFDEFRVSVNSKEGFDTEHCCCKKTAASSWRDRSASDKLLASLSSNSGWVASRAKFACFRKSRVIFSLFCYWTDTPINRYGGSRLALPHWGAFIVPVDASTTVPYSAKPA